MPRGLHETRHLRKRQSSVLLSKALDLQNVPAPSNSAHRPAPTSKKIEPAKRDPSSFPASDQACSAQLMALDTIISSIEWGIAALVKQREQESSEYLNALIALQRTSLEERKSQRAWLQAHPEGDRSSTLTIMTRRPMMSVRASSLIDLHPRNATTLPAAPLSSSVVHQIIYNLVLRHNRGARRTKCQSETLAT